MTRLHPGWQHWVGTGTRSTTLQAISWCWVGLVDRAGPHDLLGYIKCQLGKGTSPPVVFTKA